MFCVLKHVCSGRLIPGTIRREIGDVLPYVVFRSKTMIEITCSCDDLHDAIESGRNKNRVIASSRHCSKVVASQVQSHMAVTQITEKAPLPM